MFLTQLQITQPHLPTSLPASISASGSNVIHPNDFWLPGEVLPVHYNLSLKVNMEDLTTEGKVSILLDVVRPTTQITLHVHPDILKLTHSVPKVEDIGEKRGQLKGLKWMQKSSFIKPS